jgi:5-deoxy-glucuronate isomerase
MSLYRPNGSLQRDGASVLLTPEEAGWDYCGLQVFTLSAGGSRDVDLTGIEAAVVPLSGACHITTGDGELELVGRRSVFDGIPDVAYVAPGTKVVITSHEDSRVAVATARAEKRGRSFKIEASSISREMRGAGQATRQINGLLSAEVDGPQHLIVVEVLTPEGNWSSYPPHKHDEWDAGEVPIEEIYYFEMSSEVGFGFHRTYTSDKSLDETVTVRSGDVFLIPRGYHGPCVAAPGYDMYYLNVMAGPDPERRWLISTDPDHAWLWESWIGGHSDPRLPMTGATPFAGI